jgi:hypothetical protein
MEGEGEQKFFTTIHDAGRICSESIIVYPKTVKVCIFCMVAASIIIILLSKPSKISTCTILA